MARARGIKPGFFRNEDLADCSPWARLCFIGLWTLADREGRLEDRPKRIKGELFAFESFDVEPLLAELESHRFILRYAVDEHRFIQVLEFVKHQQPHYKEPPSGIPAPRSGPTSSADRPQNPGFDGQSSGSEPGNDRPQNPGMIDPKTQERRGGQHPLTADCGLLTADCRNSVSGARATSAQVDGPPAAAPKQKKVKVPEPQPEPQPTGRRRPQRQPAGTRLPADWSLPPDWEAWARDEFEQWSAQTVQAIADEFADHWHASASPDATKADWAPAWRSWCGSEITQRRHGGVNGAGNGASAAPPRRWQDIRAEVINHGCAVGLGPWNEVDAYLGKGPSWEVYRRDVIAAVEQQEQQR